MRLANNADMAIIPLILLESSVIDVLLLIAALTLHLHQISRTYLEIIHHSCNSGTCSSWSAC